MTTADAKVELVERFTRWLDYVTSVSNRRAEQPSFDDYRKLIALAALEAPHGMTEAMDVTPEMIAAGNAELPESLRDKFHAGLWRAIWNALLQAARPIDRQERKICTFCDGRGIYDGKDIVTGEGFELACQYCDETGFALSTPIAPPQDDER